MSLAEWFASIRKGRRRSAPQSTYEEGAQITRRLQELLANSNPTKVENPPNASSEDGRELRVG
jgi:hypothetical protein